MVKQKPNKSPQPTGISTTISSQTHFNHPAAGLDVGQHKIIIVNRYIPMILVALMALLQGAIAEEFMSKEFNAKIISVELLSSFRGTAKVVAYDPRFVATLELEEDVEELGKKGERVNVAIHSPALALHQSKYPPTDYPLRFRFRLSKYQPSGSLNLQGIGANVEQPGAGEPATKPAVKVPAEVQPPSPTPKD